MQLKIVFKFFICWNNYQQYSKKNSKNCYYDLQQFKFYRCKIKQGEIITYQSFESSSKTIKLKGTRKIVGKLVHSAPLP